MENDGEGVMVDPVKSSHGGTALQLFNGVNPAFFDEFEKALWNNTEARKCHDFILDIFSKKEMLFPELAEICRDRGIFFVPQPQEEPGAIRWSTPTMKSCDRNSGELKIEKVLRVIMVPYWGIQVPEKDRKELICSALLLSHEMGHIEVFENEDVARLLACPFVKLFRGNKRCTYLELRAWEEGIKIAEEIMDKKYDSTTREKRKMWKFFFTVIYSSKRFEVNFFEECAVELERGKLAVKTESDMCPVMRDLRETVGRINPF